MLDKFGMTSFSNSSHFNRKAGKSKSFYALYKRKHEDQRRSGTCEPAGSTGSKPLHRSDDLPHDVVSFPWRGTRTPASVRFLVGSRWF
jgi:hypothetical protein